MVQLDSMPNYQQNSSCYNKNKIKWMVSLAEVVNYDGFVELFPFYFVSDRNKQIIQQ